MASVGKNIYSLESLLPALYLALNFQWASQKNKQKKKCVILSVFNKNGGKKTCILLKSSSSIWGEEVQGFGKEMNTNKHAVNLHKVNCMCL